MVATDPYTHLEQRCRLLMEKYIDPIIQAEKESLENGVALPDPDFDSVAAFRLLSHAELEGYFEAKASLALASLDTKFKNNNAITSEFASLITLYLWKQKRQPNWTLSGANDTTEAADFKKLAQEAMGYGRQFVADNNGIKENSIGTLSALMGYFNDDLDQVLVSELNQYGKKRGDVAHDSWARDTRTFESADIEKNRLEKILTLTKSFYETTPQTKINKAKPSLVEKILTLLRPPRFFLR